ncbi:MAG: hypothetical protein ACJ73D_03775 [Pyrinomonadaceae bacterium]
MAGQISDEQFKTEMLDFKGQMIQFVGVANQKFDGLTSDVRTNSFRLDKFEAKIDSLGTEIQNLTSAVRDLASTVGAMSKQLSAVTSKVVDHEQRLNGHETRIGALEAETH